ncbi:MAG: BolA family transcriptional regulator [Stellaceae bacterium]|jgi:stress-induced morphogen
MALDAATIEKLIKAGLPDARITIEALVDDDNHWSAHVVSSAFKGKSRVQQHQMVYRALGSRMGNELHALALQTSAPEE